MNVFFKFNNRNDNGEKFYINLINFFRSVENIEIAKPEEGIQRIRVTRIGSMIQSSFGQISIDLSAGINKTIRMLIMGIPQL